MRQLADVIERHPNPVKGAVVRWVPVGAFPRSEGFI